MIKTEKKSIISKMIKQNKLSKSQAFTAQLIQNIYKGESLIGRQADSSQKIYVDNCGNNSAMEHLYNKDKLEQKAIFKAWKKQILSGELDPLIYHICYSILHYNISPKNIAKEFTEQLYSKPSNSLLMRLDIKVTTYKIEKMFKQGLDLFEKISRNF